MLAVQSQTDEKRSCCESVQIQQAVNKYWLHLSGHWCSDWLLFFVNVMQDLLVCF